MEPTTLLVAYGDPRQLEECLASLKSPAPVLIVDNGGPDSTPGEVERIASTYGARRLDAGGNIGFASAVNLALGSPAASDRDVLLLNPDARIGWSDVLKIQEKLRAGHYAAASPLLRYPDGRPQTTEWPLPSVRGEWLAVAGLLHRVKPDGTFLAGSVLMLRAEALSEVGDFDERFFLYGEEADWQRRARDQGWNTVLVPEVSAVHQGGGTSHDENERLKRFQSAAYVYIDKWYGRRGLSRYRRAERLVEFRRRFFTRGG
ncbi:MAG TPA: glycosyltransferase family 2 protein [Acidimicrobiales bacterium]|nr:glycosyltransferase family 2 protein [Acidimicrobiales bacterium]